MKGQVFCDNGVFYFQAGTKKQKYERISEKKMSTPVEILCKVGQASYSLLTRFVGGENRIS